MVINYNHENGKDFLFYLFVPCTFFIVNLFMTFTSVYKNYLQWVTFTEMAILTSISLDGLVS